MTKYFNFDAIDESIFDDQWQDGIVWCGEESAWIWVKGKQEKHIENYEGKNGTFDKELNDKLINKCPYLLEHTINA